MSCPYRESDRDEYLKFPCPIDGNYVRLQDCPDCERSNNCDIYATMLDEDFE